MKISMIAAVARNGVIGVGGHLPWKLPADLARFKALTLGKPVIMGRKTWDSIGKALPGRRNIVISRQNNFLAPGAIVVARPKDALIAADTGEDEVMIIGGSFIYEEFMPLANQLYITQIAIWPLGNAFFPDIDPIGWNEILREEHLADTQNAYAYTFLTYERV